MLPQASRTSILDPALGRIVEFSILHSQLVTAILDVLACCLNEGRVKKKSASSDADDEGSQGTHHPRSSSASSSSAPSSQSFFVHHPSKKCRESDQLRHAIKFESRFK